MGHACHAKSICSPRKHVRLHEDETQHPRCGHHPSTTDSPTIFERNCHEQRLCKSLLETTLDRVAELESSSTWFSKRSIQGRLVANTPPMISTSPKQMGDRSHCILQSRRWRTRRSADAGHVFLGVAARTARAPVRAPTRRTSPSLPRRHLHPSPPSRLAELYRRLEQLLLRHAHLRLKASKTKVWNCAGLLPPGVPALAPDSLSGSAIPHCPRRSVV